VDPNISVREWGPGVDKRLPFVNDLTLLNTYNTNLADKTAVTICGLDIDSNE